MTEQKMREIHTGESGRDVNYRTIVSVTNRYLQGRVLVIYNGNYRKVKI